MKRKQVILFFAAIAILVSAASPRELAAATVRGTVTDIDSALPPDDPRVELFLTSASGDPEIRTALIDANGQYLFANLPAGAYRLRLEATFYGDQCWGTSAVDCYYHGSLIFLNETTEVVANFQLVPLGRISGTVRRQDGSPVAGALVTLGVDPYPYGGTWVTDAAGRYFTGPIEASDYYLKVADVDGLYGVTYPHAICPAGNPCAGEYLRIRNGVHLEGIDFTLKPGGTLRGQALKPDGAAYVMPFGVRAFDRHGTLIASAQFDSGDGIFELGLLPPGRYTLQAEGVEKVIYPNLPCSARECDVRFGEPVAVAAGLVTGDLRLTFPERVSVRFELREAGTQAPISQDDAFVEVIDARTGESHNSFTLPDFAIVAQLLPGSYFVYAYAGNSRWIAEWPDGEHLAWNNSWEDILDQEKLEVRHGQPATVTFSLDTSARVRARILLADGSPAPNCGAYHFGAGAYAPSFIYCLGNGYIEARLRPGPAWLLFNEISFLSEGSGILHDGRPCAFEYDFADADLLTCDLAATPPLQLAAGDEIDLGDLRLAAVGGLRGTIHGPFGQGRLEVYDLAGRLVRVQEVYGQGYEYQVLELAPGSYRLLFEGRTDLGSEVYPDLPCQPATCDPGQGEVVVVEPGQILEGIDFSPPPAIPGFCAPHEPCLVEGRFRVGVRWTDPHGQTGDGQWHRVPNTDQPDTAYFWFFTDDNIELVIKVLDACGTVSERFWVFAAGSTNVGVDFEVTDTVTGETRRYHQQGGSPFEPVLDTDAFACGGGAPAPALAEERSAALTPLPWGGGVGEGAPISGQDQHRAAPPANTSFCFADLGSREGLCLLGERFRVDATWQSFDGSDGRGQVSDHGAGSLYFFDPDNVEVMMKVLDGCALNGHYWVFGTGLTNVGVRLLVTDTHTDRQKVYENPLGNPFAPILDTAAFPCWRE